MSAEENKKLIRRFFDEVWNQGHVELAEEFVADGYVSHNYLSIEALGPEGIRRAVLAQKAAFPDQHTTIEDLIAEDDKVVVRGRDDLTHVGDFMGYPGTGRKVTVTWIDIFRIKDGKLVEAWLETDSRLFAEQLKGAEG
ncbi:MAG: ester cyclase [Chloroflexia bacterium]